MKLDNVWLINNGFKRMDYAYNYPVVYQCKVCENYNNIAKCNDCSKRYYQDIISKPTYNLLITWIKWIN